MLETKSLCREGWKRVVERQYAQRRVLDGFMDGWIGLIRIEAVACPLVVTYEGTTLTIVDQGYALLQVAPSNANWWLSAYIGKEGKILQYYIDVTWENHTEGESPFFEDLYLDVVFLPDGRHFLLDQDELDGALAQGVIGQEQYDLAVQTAREI
ncbi:MAG TPA: DUF402 domain-containing protein, partial [Clostridia bacterium]|nr:DUF402 domain-containing protein [Clostridia bacterium]